jgi:type I restriction enzyme, S subunit
LEGLEVSEILLSNLEFSKRLDAEYYRKYLLQYENKIRKNNKYTELSQDAKFLIGPFGSAFNTENYIQNGEFRYVRGQDVKPFTLKDQEVRYLPKADYFRLEKYALKENDILISVVGTLGNACIVSQKDLPAIFSCKSTVVRTNKLNPNFLLTFLNCKFGKELLLRKERGAIQKGLNLEDLKTVLVPNFSDFFQIETEKILIKANQKVEQSKSLYAQSEQILLQEIGLQNFEPSKEPVNIKSFKESFGATKRLDAEYYQLKYEQVIEKILVQNHDSLVNIVNISKSIEPGSNHYSEEAGMPFYRVSDYNKFGLRKPDKELTNSFVSDNKELIIKIKPKKDTILFSKDGSVGTAYLLRKDLDGITSGAILHLQIKNTKEIIPEYLTLALNSKLVQMQAERDAGGSIILHWRKEEIEQVVVPIINFQKQQEIAELIQESFQLKAESERLLEVAKKAVEMAIEEGEEMAIDYIEKSK